LASLLGGLLLISAHFAERIRKARMDRLTTAPIESESRQDIRPTQDE
jgi:hypothetical protein